MFRLRVHFPIRSGLQSCSWRVDQICRPSEINNLLVDYEQQLSTSQTTPRSLGKCMLMYMVRGLFTSLKFLYVQFPVASTKGSDIFPLVWPEINHLTHLGLCVTTITCDSASDNQKMFAMFNSLSYKTTNVFNQRQEQYFLLQIFHISLKQFTTAL